MRGAVPLGEVEGGEGGGVATECKSSGFDGDRVTDGRTSSLSLIVIANGGSSSSYRRYPLSLLYAAAAAWMRGSYGVVAVLLRSANFSLTGCVNPVPAAACIKQPLALALQVQLPSPD